MEPTGTIEVAKTSLDYIEQLGPTLVAIVAIVTTFSITARQIRATTISTSRQQWIASLQDALSRYMTNAIALMYSKPPSVTDHFHALNLAMDTVAVMLVDDDKDHQTLYKSLETLLKLCLSYRPNRENDSKKEGDFQTARDQAIKAARIVINNEWTKIKQSK